MKKSLIATRALLAACALAAVMVVRAVGEKISAAVQGSLANNGLVLGLNTSADAYTGKFPVRIQPISCDVTEVGIPFDFPTANPSIGDLLLLCKVPAGVTILDFDVIPEDADTNGAPTLVFSVGSVNAGLTDLTTVYKAGCTGAQSGTIERCVLSTAFSEASTAERGIALKFTAAAATYATGKKGVLVLRVRG